MSDSSLTSLSDEDVPPEQIRTIRDRRSPFEIYDEWEFKDRFRFSKEAVMDLLHIFGRDLQPLTNRNKSIDPLNQLLLTLRFYATGAFQQLLGDTINVHKSTVCRIVKRVTHQIALLKPEYINMPSQINEINGVILGFYNIAGFPRVVGAIDCTHIKISSPGGNDAERFRNRKGFFSINVQAVCDSTLKIRHIIARWPGSVHDSTIFNDSGLSAELENGLFGTNYLVGDSGYPCKSTLLTPFLNPQSPSEEAYNQAHIATRNVVERCFGVLKRRFPCLHVGMALKIKTVLSVIVACCVLHNYAIQLGEDPPGEELLLDADDEVMGNAGIVAAAAIANQNTAVRTVLVNTVFNTE